MSEEIFKRVGEITFAEDPNDARSFKKGEAKNEFRNETFYSTYWIPGTVKGAVFLCHGYGEYISFVYEEICSRLANQNLLVFGHDHLGHGRSSGERVQVKNGFNEYVDPILAHVEEVKTWPVMLKEDGSPKDVFIIGISMGGLISMMTILKNESIFKGLVLNGPLIQIDPKLKTPFKLFGAKILKSIAPRFVIGNINPRLISRDAQVCEKFINDNIVYHGGYKVKHSLILIQTCEAIEKNLGEITIPICVLHGGEDKVINTEGSKLIYEKVGSKDKFFKIFDGAFHNLYIELPDVKEDAMKLTEMFILDRLSN